MRSRGKTRKQAKNSHKGAIGAVAIKGRRIVSKSFNRPISNFQLKKYGYKNEHAEYSAILKANGKEIDTIFVVRTLRDGKMSCAKPCCLCVDFMRNNGIKRVYYSDWDGIIKRMKL